MKPRPDYTDLIQNHTPYKATHLGHLLLNGKLVHANASAGCFFVISDQFSTANIPDNLRVNIYIQGTHHDKDLTIYLKRLLYANLLNFTG